MSVTSPINKPGSYEGEKYITTPNKCKETIDKYGVAIIPGVRIFPEASITKSPCKFEEETLLIRSPSIKTLPTNGSLLIPSRMVTFLINMLSALISNEKTVIVKENAKQKRKFDV